MAQQQEFAKIANGAVVMRGWLRRRGGEKGNGWWHKHFFVLRKSDNLETCFEYYDKEKETLAAGQGLRVMHASTRNTKCKHARTHNRTQTQQHKRYAANTTLPH